MDNQYKMELAQAKANLADFKERGEDATGGTWDELRRELFTPEEIAASDLRVAMMIELAHTQDDNDISQHELEPLLLS
jgi:hypothetical protein